MQLRDDCGSFWQLSPGCRSSQPHAALTVLGSPLSRPAMPSRGCLLGIGRDPHRSSIADLTALSLTLGTPAILTEGIRPCVTSRRSNEYPRPVSRAAAASGINGSISIDIGLAPLDRR
jgi:hypothetical protein